MGYVAGVDYNSEPCSVGFDRSKDRFSGAPIVFSAPTPEQIAAEEEARKASAAIAAETAFYWKNQNFLSEGGWAAAVSRAVAHHGHCPNVLSAAFNGRVTKKEISLWKEIKDDLEKGCKEDVITAEWLDDFFDDWFDA